MWHTDIKTYIYRYKILSTIRPVFTVEPVLDKVEDVGVAESVPDPVGGEDQVVPAGVEAELFDLGDRGDHLHQGIYKESNRLQRMYAKTVFQFLGGTLTNLYTQHNLHRFGIFVMTYDLLPVSYTVLPIDCSGLYKEIPYFYLHFCAP